MNEEAAGRNGSAAGLLCRSAEDWALTGDLTQATVRDVHLEAARQPISPGLVLDLSGVGRIDSAALALLLSIARRVRAAGGQLDIRQAPAALVALAGVTGLGRLLRLTPA